MLVLVEPDILQPRNGRDRQARRILAEQGSKRLLEITGRNALQVKDRDQHLQAAGAPRIGRQDRRCEADAPGTIGSATVAPREAGVRRPGRYRSSPREQASARDEPCGSSQPWS